MLFFTAQNANMLGRLNPKTGEIKVVDDADGALESVRHGDDHERRAVRLRLRHEQDRQHRSRYAGDQGIHAAERREPAAAHRDHAPTTSIWYADYSRGYLGRLDPKTGKVNEWPSPSGPKSQPYGITYLNGAIWYVESAIKPNALVRFDLKTEKFQSWIIPGGGGVVRNMMATTDGNLVMAESGVNKIALVVIGGSAKSN